MVKLDRNKVKDTENLNLLLIAESIWGIRKESIDHKIQKAMDFVL